MSKGDGGGGGGGVSMVVVQEVFGVRRGVRVKIFWYHKLYKYEGAYVQASVSMRVYKYEDL